MGLDSIGAMLKMIGGALLLSQGSSLALSTRVRVVAESLNIYDLFSLWLNLVDLLDGNFGLTSVSPRLI